MTTITVDNSTGFLTAVQSAHAGDTILLEPGTYAPFTLRNAQFTGTVTIASANPLDPAVLTGMSLNTSSGLTFSDLAFSTGGSTIANPFMVTNSSNIAFTGLNVYGALGQPATAQTINGLSFESDTNISVTNSQFQLFRNGITETNSNNVTISGNTLHDFSGDAVDNGGSTNVLISDNTIYDDYTPVDGQHPDGIQFWTNTATPAGSNIIVTGNVIYRGNGDLFQGVFMRQGTGGDIFTNVTIDNNTLFGLIYNGVYVQGAAGVNIANNVITGFTDYISRVVVEDASDVAVTGDNADRFIYVSVTGLTQSGDTELATIPITTAAPTITTPTPTPTSGPPVVAAPVTATINQNAATAIAGVSLSESGAAASETFTVTLTDASGDLGATGTGVSGAGTTSLTITGSLAQVNSDLATLTDTDASTAADTITLSASDSLGVVATPASIAVSVNAAPVIGPPVIAAPATATASQNVATAIAGVSLSESGAAASETFTVTLTDASGDLGATGTGVSGVGTTSLTITGSLAQVNSDLATLTDTDASTTADTITLTARDSLGVVATPAAIAVSVNAAPVITVPASETIGIGQAGAIAGVSISNTGGKTGETYTVTLTDTNGDLSQTANQGSVTGNGTPSLTIVGTLAQVNSDLASLSDPAASVTTGSIAVNAKDSLGGVAKTAAIAVTVNGSPVITAPSSASVGQKQLGAIAGISLSESGNTTGEIFTVTLSDTSGALSASGVGVSGAGTTKLVLSGSLAQVNSDLATLTDTDASTATDAITITARDSFGDASTPATVAVGVTKAGHGFGWKFTDLTSQFVASMSTLTTSSASSTAGATIPTNTAGAPTLSTPVNVRFTLA